MSWEDILKEFTPNSESNQYYKIIELLDYIIENYPDKADKSSSSNAKSVKKDIDELLDEHYKAYDKMSKKLSDLSKYITRGKSNTLRDSYIELADDLANALFE
jgi:hypothetical protein